MKIQAMALAFAAVCITPMAAQAEDCTDKQQLLEHRIQYAKQYENKAQVAGLQKALDEVTAHCTSQSLRDRAIEKLQKAQRNSQHAQDDVVEAEQRLHKAQASGDASDVAKAQRKLAEKQAKWEQRQDEVRRAESAARGL